MRQKGFAQIIVILLLLVLVGGGAYYFGTKKGNITPTPTQTQPPIVINIPQPTPNNNPTVTPKVQTKSCNNDDLRVSLGIPSSWICNSTETVGAGWLKITSDIFEINISALGRGPFCNPGSGDPKSPLYDPTYSCKVTGFYSGNNINLKLYSLNGENKEIFGFIENGPWFSVKWKNMETTSLSLDQKNQLLTILNSFVYSK